MPELRNGAAALACAAVPLLLVATASPAAAHGSMTDPVSRVAACHAEGPESPKSDACKAAVAASGTQAFYDWNEVNIGDAAGRHRQLIPDGSCAARAATSTRGSTCRARTGRPALSRRAATPSGTRRPRRTGVRSRCT